MNAPAFSQLPNVAGFNLGQSGPRTLVSVYPREQVLTLRHEGSKTYTMPKAEPGKHVTLRVDDTFSINKNYGTGQMYRADVSAAVVAENLVHAWTRGKVGTDSGFGPGIIICEKAEPSPHEIQMANDRQTAYFRHLVNQADSLHANGENKEITDEHRLAAEWMGLGDRQWSRPIERVEMKRCPACAEEIRSDAKLCRHCRTNIDDFIAAQLAKLQPVAAVEPVAESKPKHPK
jgi:hypothetical protein